MAKYVYVQPQGVIYDIRNINIKWYQSINEFFTGGGYVDVWKRTQSAPTQALTSNYNINLVSDYNTIFTNEGSSGAVTIFLPPATRGLEYRFREVGVNMLTVQPQSGDHFFGHANGKYKQSNTDGSLLRISCATNGVWDVEIQLGTWADQP